MKEKEHPMHRDDNDNKVTSISTPLGRIAVDSKLVNKSFIDWTKDILTKDKDGNKDNKG